MGLYQLGRQRSLHLIIFLLLTEVNKSDSQATAALNVEPSASRNISLGEINSDLSRHHEGHNEHNACDIEAEDVDLSASCHPCRNSDWLDLVTSKDSIVRSDKACYNNNPITGYEDKTSHGTTEVAIGKYRISTRGDLHATQGFIIRKQGFFRYAVEIGGNSSRNSSSGSSSGGANPEDFLDLDNMKKYYERNGTVDADFQILEWPGRTYSEEKAAKEKTLVDKRPARCAQAELQHEKPCLPQKVWMLEFERSSGKIQHYPCNSEEGTNVVAVGAIEKSDPNPANYNADEAKQKIWLSHGRESVYNNYIQPLFIPERIMIKMAKNEGKECLAEEPFGELRAVLDFTFTQHRLILGMKCGIVVVSGLTTKELTFDVSTLRSESGLGTNLFPEPINELSASACCANLNICSRGQSIVAAYSFHGHRAVDENKFMYISFDIGDTFEKKIIASPHSPVNLIKGLYKFYSKWDDYFEILHDPDEDDLKEDDELLRALRKKPLWDASSTEDKENLLTLAVPIPEKNATIIRKVWDILKTRVPNRRNRKRNQGIDVDEDKTPLWANRLISRRRAQADWKESWTDETCDGIPECARKFEDDRAVKWLLGDVGIVVKTSKRDENEPFCKEITSILVLPEERHIMALCEIGYGHVEGSGRVRRSPENPGMRTGPTPESSRVKRNVSSASTSFTTTTVTGVASSSTDSTTAATITSSTTTINSATKSGSGSGLSTTIVNSTYGGGGGTGTGGGMGTGTSNKELSHFALFNFQVKKNAPMIHGYRVSQRIFTCKYIRNTMDPNKIAVVQPELYRVPGTANIIIKNCDGILYLSTNFGNTLFNVAFYYENSSVENYCKQDSHYQPVETEPCTEDERGPPGNDLQRYIRTFRLCALNVPPIMSADVSGNVLMMTFGGFYARGAIAYNTEVRLVVGKILENLPFDRRFENIMFPGLNTNGEAVLTISLTKAYSIPNTNFRNKLYNDKHALRLVQMPVQFYTQLQNYHNENLALCQNAAKKKYGFNKCQTISFYVTPKTVNMDIGESAGVKVRVLDDNAYLPLWLFSSNENSVAVKAKAQIFGENQDNRTRKFVKNDEQKALNEHTWLVIIKVLANHKQGLEGESLVDAFYGSDYNTLNDYSAQVSMVNAPTVRCHVQPSSTVSVGIGCKEKRLIAHEDSHRLQCSRFKKHFNYTLKKGKFDRDLVNYWLSKESKQAQPLFKMLPNGDLEITYDYSRWGCPLEPFRSDPFLPDLRVVENGQVDGKPFSGKFILIEMFGAKGFSYSHKVRDMGCTRAPQNSKTMIQGWKYRQRLFSLATKWLKFPNSSENITSEYVLRNITGSPIFYNEAVKEHLNIWNRANYLSCTASNEDDLTEEVLDQEYEVMETMPWIDEPEEGHHKKRIQSDEEDNTPFVEEVEEEDESKYNKIIWAKDHPRVLLFLAVAVDEYDSLCTYQTVFGVSLKTNPDWDDLFSFLTFLFLVIFWLLLVIGGYHFRKRYLRISYFNLTRDERLEQAAWTLVYRYEKLVHGRTVDNFRDTIFEKDDVAGLSGTTKSAHDKRRDELRMKRTNILAQEQAKHEKLQKLFQKQA